MERLGKLPGVPLALEARSAEACLNIIGLGLQEAVDALYPDRGDGFRETFVARYRDHWFSDSHASELFAGARETLELLKEVSVTITMMQVLKPGFLVILTTLLLVWTRRCGRPA